jgi:cyclic beta-1,2-glucan synthetase
MAEASTTLRTGAASRSDSERVVAPALRIVERRRGDVRSSIDSYGAGCLEVDGLAVLRGRESTPHGDLGVAVYVRDLDSGQFWSVGLQPTGLTAESYRFHADEAAAQIHRREDGVDVEMRVELLDEGVDRRTVRLTNVSERNRRIEVTSYLEWVLQAAAADDAHPAFSKLFVETSFDPKLGLILARRRQREPHQRVLVGGHWISAIQGRTIGDRLEWETSRAAFLGRGRQLDEPVALTNGSPLTGTSGPVLDPAASLRRSFLLSPDESAVIAFDVCGALSADDVQRAARRSSPGKAVSVRSNHDGQRRVAELDGSDVRRRVDSPHLSFESSAEDTFLPLECAESVPRGGDRFADSAAELLFDNGLGGFAPSGEEYVIRLTPSADGRLQLPPLPWSHVVANEHAGFIATERGSGPTWTLNSRENRLSSWANDPISDPLSEVLYLRDLDRRRFWSTTPGPAGDAVPHEVRYGFGYVEYRHEAEGLACTLRQFVPKEDAIKISSLTIKNFAHESRRLDAASYVRLELGSGARLQRDGLRTWRDEASGALFAKNPDREHAERIAFTLLVVEGEDPRRASFTCDRDEFLGVAGRLASPAALCRGDRLSGRPQTGDAACFVQLSPLSVASGGETRVLVLTGEADGEEAARELIAKHRSCDAAAQALSDVRRFWRETLSTVKIETPSEELDVLVNGWLPYQTIACRLWGRSAYYQSGGAFGFRDQLQDAAALVYHRPDFTRRQVLLNAAHQFPEGDVLHWWHPPQSRGIRTRFADDLLWLPLAAAEYAATTGDSAVWDEVVGFVDGPTLADGEAERFFAPTRSERTASVYEHCCLAVDRSLAAGAHGLPLMGCGDWNDGMSAIGLAGRGESVWMGFFLHLVVQRLLPECRRRGDHKRIAAYEARLKTLSAALDDAGWDGRWYRRAYFDGGQPLGTASGKECQIDALVQAWAVLSRAGDPERIAPAVAAVEERLVDEECGMIRLLDPPFDVSQPSPGYIQGYVPGVRENGGQYTHGILWFVRAMAELGRGTRAVELLEMLTPIRHTTDPQTLAVYQAEPYVVAADVYGEAPHEGRAGWTWYTGSAGWMLRVAVESILGLSLDEGRRLRLNPCISARWGKCRLSYRLPGGSETYHIEVLNPEARQQGVKSATCDGRTLTIEDGAAVAAIVGDGQAHHIVLHL